MPALITVTGCSTAEITQLWISEPADIAYTCLELDIDLGKKNETEKLTNTFVRQLKRYHIYTSLRSSHSEISNSLCSNFAILKIREIKREYVTVRYIRGLASPMLTQMRGRRYAQKPIITMRTLLSDGITGKQIYQGDYITEGQWYLDSSSVVSSLASVIVSQFESEGLIKSVE